MQSLNAYVAVSRDGGAQFVQRPLIPAVSGSEELAMTSASSIFVAFSSSAGTGTTQYTLLSSDEWQSHLDVLRVTYPAWVFSEAKEGQLGFSDPRGMGR